MILGTARTMLTLQLAFAFIARGVIVASRDVAFEKFRYDDVKGLALLGCQQEREKQRLMLEWPSGKVAVHELWLLDNRPDWKHATGQKVRNADIDAMPKLLDVECNTLGLTVVWKEGTGDPSKVFFSSEFLARWAGPPPAQDARKPTALDKNAWAKHVLKPHNYYSVINSDRGLLDLMDDVEEHGAALIEAAIGTGSVTKLANRMGGEMMTLYGPTWTVKSEVDEGPKNNIAYSTLGLPLHQDLVYYESMPGLQILHCMVLSDDVIGGESTLLDAFHAAEILRQDDPEAFKILQQIPRTFMKLDMQRERPAQFEYHTPHIHTHPQTEELVKVVWSPPFEGPLRASIDQVEDYYRARKAFEAAIEKASKTHLLVYRMKPGQVVVFNNQRMFHGRQEFTLNATGKGKGRSLEGSYVNIDEFRNRLQVARQQVHGTAPGAHERKALGNRCLATP